MRIVFEEEKGAEELTPLGHKTESRKGHRKVKLGREDFLLVIVVPSIIILIYYAVFAGELTIKDALSFLTGLLGGAWVGTSTGLSSKRTAIQ